MTIGGRAGAECSSSELSAIVADFIGGLLPRSHPAYFVAVGQFDQGHQLLADAVQAWETPHYGDRDVTLDAVYPIIERMKEALKGSRENESNRHFPSNTGTSLLAVLVEDETGGLAVYEALIKLPPPSNRQAYMAERASKAQSVMHLGTKCSLTKAYFGAVTDKNYRP